jgi:uncharacterized protein
VLVRHDTLAFPLKFQPDSLPGVNVVTAFAPGQVIVNATAWSRSVIVPWHGEVRAWAPQRPEELAAEHVAALLECEPEVVVYGSGPTLRFPSPAVMRALIDARVGYETMDSGAACRTYNVLATEGRRVVLAVLA